MNNFLNIFKYRQIMWLDKISFVLSSQSLVAYLSDYGKPQLCSKLEVTVVILVIY